jgi:predicted CoA-binding protein
MEKYMSDDQIKNILNNSKTIAMIGVSSEKKGEDPKNLKRKPANVVMKYMQDFGYKVIPVNPFVEGEIINGETVIGSLEKISEQVDIVDIFRPSKETPGIANEAVKIGSKVLWLQYGIQNEEAEKIAENAKIEYVSNKCIKQEYQRLFQKANPVFPVLKN